jgi:hypothetical protein
LEHLAVNAKVATVMGSIPAYFGHSGILGAAYEAALNYVVKKKFQNLKNPSLKKTSVIDNFLLMFKGDLSSPG